MKSPLAALVAASAMVLAACGGTGGSSSGVASLEDVVTTQAVETETDQVTGQEATEQAFLAFAQCMRDQGIDMADPTVDTDGNVIPARPNFASGSGTFDREAMQSARDTCGDALEGIVLGFERRDDTEFQDQALAYAQCMRDNGVDMPDPDFSEGSGPGRGLFGGGDIDPTDPTFQSANEACEDLAPGRGGFGGGPGRAPGGTN